MWGDQASTSKCQTGFYYLNAVITLRLFKEHSEEMRCGLEPSRTKTSLEKGHRRSMQKCPDRVIQVAVRYKKSVEKLLCCEILLSFHSAPGKKGKEGAIVVRTRRLSTKKISVHFRCPFQSPSFHLSHTISPALVVFLGTSSTMMHFLSRSKRSACQEESGNKKKTKQKTTDWRTEASV